MSDARWDLFWCFLVSLGLSLSVHSRQTLKSRWGYLLISISTIRSHRNVHVVCRTWRRSLHHSLLLWQQLLFQCYFKPFHSWEWSMSKFPCSLTRNMTLHSKENLAFHSLLRWKMILIQILTTLLMHFLFRRLGECTFWAQEWKG